MFEIVQFKNTHVLKFYVLERNCEIKIIVVKQRQNKDCIVNYF